MSDGMFILLEGEPEEKTFDALLLDEDLFQFFKRDALVWPELKVIWQSEPLPPGLVVLVGKNRDKNVQELFDALAGMNSDSEGARLLGLMKSSGFIPVNTSLLDSVIRKYASH
jgi:ABC-type phosphate/phosphonate transport system substrate-binding protein